MFGASVKEAHSAARFGQGNRWLQYDPTIVLQGLQWDRIHQDANDKISRATESHADAEPSRRPRQCHTRVPADQG